MRTAPLPRPVTAEELDGLPRPQRVRRIWLALGEARERAWARLSGDQRVDALLLLHDDIEET